MSWTIAIAVFYAISLFALVFFTLVFFEKNGKEGKKILNNKELPPVTVTIPAYNEEDTLAATIESALALDYPKDLLEIIVVNDGSKDKTEGIAKKFLNKGIILINQKNQGKAAALNNALKLAKGEFFVCLDADSVVEKSALKKMLLLFDNENVAAVTPVMKVKNPANFLQKLQWLEYIMAVFLKNIMSSMNTVYVTPGPFSLYRKNVIEKLGGFDKEAIAEDMEIAYRLQNNHYKINQSNGGDVFTEAPRGIFSLYTQRRRWYKGSIQNILKYRKMLFNKEYGDFGLFQMPMNILAPIIGVVIAVLFTRFMLWPIVQWGGRMLSTAFNYIFINKQILEMSSSLFSGKSLRLFFLSVDLTTTFVLIVATIITLAMLWYAHKQTKEKFKVAGIISVVLFFFFYYILLSFMWVGSLIEYAMKKRKW